MPKKVSPQFAHVFRSENTTAAAIASVRTIASGTAHRAADGFFFGGCMAGAPGCVESAPLPPSRAPQYTQNAALSAFFCPQFVQNIESSPFCLSLRASVARNAARTGGDRRRGNAFPALSGGCLSLCGAVVRRQFDYTVWRNILQGDWRKQRRFFARKMRSPRIVSARGARAFILGNL